MIFSFQHKTLHLYLRSIFVLVVAALGAVFLFPEIARGSTLRSVQSGTTTSSANGTVTVAISQIDTSKAFLIFQIRSNSNRPPGSNLRGRIASPTSVEFVRVTDGVAPEPVTISIQWYVMEFSSGVRVQRGEVAQSAASINVTLPIAVGSVNQAFVTWSKTPTAADNTWDSNDPVLAELTTTSNLQIRTNSAASTHIIWWQVIEFTNPADIDVQKGSITTMSGTTTSVTATLSPPVDVAKTFVLVGYRTSGGNADIGARMLRARLTDASTVTIDRDHSGTGNDITEIVWQAIEMKDGSVIQQGNASFGSTISQVVVPLTGIDPGRAVAFASDQSGGGGQNMGSSAYSADDVLGVGSATLALSSSQLTLDRDNTAATANIAWFTAQFPKRFVSKQTGNWSTASTWAGDVVPSSTDSVTIASGHTVTLTANTIVNGLRIDAGGTLANSTFTLTNSAEYIVNGTHSGTGAITLSGTGTVIDGTGSITNTQTLTISTGAKNILATASLTFSGTIAISGAITVTNEGVVTTTASGGITGSAAGSTWINAANSTLNIAGPILATGALTASANPNTINYNGTAASQTLKAPTTYHHLVINKSAQSGILSTSGTTIVNGNLTITSGTLDVRGVTLTVNGATSVSGTLAFTTSTTGTKTFAGSVTINAGGVWQNTINAGITFRDGLTHNGTTFSSGTGTHTFNTNSQQLQGSSALSINTISVASGITLTNDNTGGVSVPTGLSGSGTFINAANRTLNIGGTSAITTLNATAASNVVNYNGNGAQTIKAANYFDLTISGARTTNNVTLASSGTIGVANTVSATATFTTGGYVITGSTVAYNGTGAQTVTLFNYNNLTISGDRSGQTVTLPAGTIGVQGSFTASATSVTYATSGNTMDYNSAGAQTISAFTYHNLTISGVRTTNSVTLVNGGTIGVANTLSATATFSTGNYITTGNTVDYNGSGAQSVATFSYNNLTLSNAGVKTFPGGTTNIAGNFVISGSATADATTNATTINLNGAGAQAIASTTYHNLTKSAAGTATLSGTVTINSDLTVSGGTLALSTFTANRATSGGTLTVANGATLSIGGTNGLPANYQAHSIGATSTINYSGASQAIGVLNSGQSYGNLTVSGSGTKTLPSGVTGVAGNLSVSGATLDATTNSSTVEFNGSGAQSIGAATYFHVSIAKTGGSTATLGGTVTINGTLTVTSGILASGANTIAVTGATNVFSTLNITSTTGTKTFGDLIINPGGVWSNSVNEAVTINGNIQNDGSLTAGTAAYTFAGAAKTISGASGVAIPSATITGTYTNNTTLTVATALSGSGGTLTQGLSATLNIGGTSGITNLVANTDANTVNYNGTGAQTLKAANYYDLIISGSRSASNVTLPTSGTVGIANTFSPVASFTTGGYINTSSTVAYNGTGAQTVALFNYNNLTISGDRGGQTVTLPPGTIGIRTTFTPSATSVVYDLAGNTIDYDGTGAQTVAAFDYNHLTVSGARTGANNVTLASTGTIGIAGMFSPVATFGTGGYVITGSTIDYNGSGAQSVATFSYNHLTLSNAGVKTFMAGTTSIAGNFIISGSAIADATTNATAINFNGTGSQSIAATSYHDLTKSAAGTATLSGAITINSDLAINGGTLADAGFQITGNAAGTMTMAASTGLILGTATDATGFPFNFTTLNMTLNSTSTVTYNSDQDQTISGRPAYGNLTLSSTAAVTKTLGGNLTVMGAMTINNNNTLDVSINDYDISIDGNWTLNSGGVFVPRGGTVTFTGTSAGQTIVGTQTFNNIIVDKTGQILNVGTLTMTLDGDLTVSSGRFSIAGTTLIVTGATSVSGELFFTATAGTKTFVGLVTVESGGTWRTTANEGFTFRGGLVHNGTEFTSGTGVYTFNTNNQELGGTSALSINSVTVTGVNLTNTNSSTVSIPTSLAGTGEFINSANSSLDLGGAFTITTLTASAVPNTVTYGGAGAQTIRAIDYYNLTSSSAGARTLANAGTIGIAGTFTPGSNTYTVTGSTVDYNGTGAQTIGAIDYNNLIVSGGRSGAIVTFGTGTIGIAGSLNLSATSVSYVTTGTTFEYTGTVAQSIAALNYEGLTVANAAGVSLAADISVTGVLTMSNGILSTGSNTLTVGSTGSVVRTNGYVFGNLAKYVSTGPTAVSFEIGDATQYTPVSIVFASVSTAGTLTGSTTAGDHADITNSGVEPSLSANRFWTFTNAGILFTSYDATFNFVAGDLDAGANTSNFIVSRRESGLWGIPSTGSRTSTSTQTLGVTGFGDFQIGEETMIKTWDGGAGTSNWSDGANWQPDGVPTSTRYVTLSVGVTVTVDVVAACKTLTLNHLDLILQILSGNTLTVAEDITLTNGSMAVLNDAMLQVNGAFTAGAMITNHGTINIGQ